MTLLAPSDDGASSYVEIDLFAGTTVGVDVPDRDGVYTDGDYQESSILSAKYRNFLPVSPRQLGLKAGSAQIIGGQPYVLAIVNYDALTAVGRIQSLNLLWTSVQQLGGSTAALQPWTPLATGTVAQAEGYATSAEGDHSHAEGAGTQAQGHDAHAEGRSRATGDGSHAEATSLATGEFAHAEGRMTWASGIHSHAEGVVTDAEGQASHAEGTSTRAEGAYSHAEGAVAHAKGGLSHAEGYYTVADGIYSHAEGAAAHALRVGEHAESSGFFGSYPTPLAHQVSRLSMAVDTASASPTVLYLGAPAEGVGGNNLPLRNSTLSHVRIRLGARKSDGTVAKAWVIDAVFDKASGTARVVGSVTKTVVAADAGASAWDVAVTTNGTDAVVTVTGAAATTIRWVAGIEIVEVRHA